MLKQITILLITLVGTKLSAQVSHQQIKGEWQLSDLLGKQISELEKKKRYIFTADSLHYYSAKVQLSGAFQLNTEKGVCYWTIPGRTSPVPLYLQAQANGTLLLWEEGKEGVKGVLIKLPPKQ